MRCFPVDIYNNFLLLLFSFIDDVIFLDNYPGLRFLLEDGSSFALAAF